MRLVTGKYTAPEPQPRPQIPDVKLQPGGSRLLDLTPYFGPLPGTYTYGVSVSNPGVAQVTITGEYAQVQALAEGTTSVVVSATATTTWRNIAVTQSFRVVVGEDAATPITYQAKRSSNIISLNDLVPSGVFDESYMRLSEGKYIPYEWRWQQTSGPDMKLFDEDLFTLPNLPHDTKLGFRVTATNADDVTRSFDLLLKVVNPDNTRPLQAPEAEAGADISKRAGKVIQTATRCRRPTRGRTRRTPPASG